MTTMHRTSEENTILREIVTTQPRRNEAAVFAKHLPRRHHSILPRVPGGGYYRPRVTAAMLETQVRLARTHCWGDREGKQQDTGIQRAPASKAGD